MNVSIEDYLNESEMQEIVRNAFADHCANVFRDDHERIFGNVAYKMVWQEVDKLIDGDIAEAIAKRVAEIIPELSQYAVFRAKGIYDREDSPGHIALKAAIAENKTTLVERVAQLAMDVTKQDVIDLLLDSDLTLQVSAR